jgi:hypothetical protein
MYAITPYLQSFQHTSPFIRRWETQTYWSNTSLIRLQWVCVADVNALRVQCNEIILIYCITFIVKALLFCLEINPPYAFMA